jgi:hypothetical protein
MLLENSTIYWVDLLASYEGEGDVGDGDAGASGDAGAGADAGASGDAGDAGSASDRTFTQDELNRFLADDRRKTEAKFKDKFDKLEVSYQDALKNKQLSDGDRQELQNQLEDLRARHRTKEQQLAHDKKQAEEAAGARIKELEDRASQWEGRYTETTIQRELQSAAVEHDAYNPDLVVTHLKASTNLEEVMDQEGKPTGKLAPMVTMMVKNDDTGVNETLKMTPTEAVEYMKKNPERYGGFFKNNIREGIGSSSATGGAMSGDGTVDVTKLTDEQYFKLRKENPAALGLKHVNYR